KVGAAGAYGATIVEVDGTYDDVNRLCAELADQYRWAIVNVNLRPFYSEGSKTLAFEVVEQLGWQAPDHIVVPVAAGSLLAKTAKAFAELVGVGLLADAPTRIHAAQAEGCAPVSTAIQRGLDAVTPVRPHSIAKSLAIGNPADGRYAARAVRASGGWGTACPEDAVLEGMAVLAETEGILSEPAGGVVVAGLRQLVEDGRIERHETVVICITGNGLKTTELFHPGEGRRLHLTKARASAGKTLGDALREPSGASRWFAEGRLDPSLLSLRCLDDEGLLAQPIDLIFSAVSKEVALEWEPRFAARVPVISTASAFRYEPDVPILIPGINDAHAEALHDQRRQRGWRGFIAPIPNCTTTGLAVSLKPLHDAFGVRTVLMTSLQAISGAGRQEGVLALDVIDNVIPFIPGEEEKVERETRKILGPWQEQAPFTVSCTCTRVNVKDGHLESVFVGMERPVGAAAASAAMERFGVDGLKGLPSAPDRLLR